MKKKETQNFLICNLEKEGDPGSFIPLLHHKGGILTSGKPDFRLERMKQRLYQKEVASGRPLPLGLRLPPLPKGPDNRAAPKRDPPQKDLEMQQQKLGRHTKEKYLYQMNSIMKQWDNLRRQLNL